MKGNPDVPNTFLRRSRRKHPETIGVSTENRLLGAGAKGKARRRTARRRVPRRLPEGMRGSERGNRRGGGSSPCQPSSAPRAPPSPPPGSRPAHLLRRQLHMQGPRGGTRRQRGGRARGWQGHRAPERGAGAHLDPWAAERPGGQSSRIGRRLPSCDSPSPYSLETRHPGAPAAPHPRWPPPLAKEEPYYRSATPPPGPELACSLVPSLRGRDPAAAKGRTIGQRARPSSAAMARGGGTLGWPQLRLSKPGETWGVTSLWLSLIGPFTIEGWGLLGEPRGLLL